MPDHNHCIDYLEFSVPDIAAAKAFYSAAFGWKFVDYGPDYTSFQDGRLSGGFTAIEAHTPVSSPTLVVIYGASLEATEKSVRAAGGSITKPAFEFPGGRRFHFRDPNGLEMAVWSDRRADGSKIE